MIDMLNSVVTDTAIRDAAALEAWIADQTAAGTPWLTEEA